MRATESSLKLLCRCLPSILLVSCVVYYPLIFSDISRIVNCFRDRSHKRSSLPRRINVLYFRSADGPLVLLEGKRL
ncbi:hypothetical protein JAAARDRAFT_595564 [Jaapia argillacea MUCL 33604]|uniref:Uncharacterized protein n=1 Tax=Jaapia argillacea MUCL 33604 TaxID=933084 RepID=A0A067PZF9_9AGAM|nr:hypothetical protein JAAARDRAFT_595564 [Jaapia argillacea MUCL 33604]